ncbi:hypothetical protein JKF63_02124 [Porcisia hertigi]|uniref:Uncharacterized protein n=1 Tax=Porcisia hertigi TaxID=2761500 RepID=A0A836ID71_9TRYP|nr:hypothetical protein JKF63_02124 [Porcisia hertigi]
MSCGTGTGPVEVNPSTGAAHITCFACSRCEYPICDSSEVLLRKVHQGPSEYAFHYNLDGLLDLEDVQVPCYSATEVVQTSTVVSESLMKFPMPPAALVVALESIVQSRKHWLVQRQSMDSRLHEHGVAAQPTADLGASVAAAASGTPSSSESSPPPPPPPADVRGDANDAPVAATTTAAPSTPIVRRYGETAENRIDLVCVKESVLVSGVQECTRDRSAVATAVATAGEELASGVESADHRAQEEVARSSPTTAPAVVRDATFPNIQADVMKSATAAVAKTSWISPGNFRLREAFIHVNRSTLSSRAPWFQGYKCLSRVQCPDCHQALGFVFCIPDAKKQQHLTSEAASEGNETRGIDDTAAPAELSGAHRRVIDQATAPLGEIAQPPHAKKTRNERDAQAAASASTRHVWQEALLHGRRSCTEECRGGGTDEAEDEEDMPEGDPHGDDGYGVGAPPDRFVGLELKRIVQREWTLSSFHERYNKSRQLSTFRELFPEAEELQSLYSRLLGLRIQTELYSSLLRRHKEQNDVQMALLMSNKDRMHTYDEKVKTMQQIIEAQRSQIAMQMRQIQNQEELVKSHQQQFATQKRQIDMEQLLLVQQSRTIESQKEQLRLLKGHFQATRPEVLLDARLRPSPCPPPSLSRVPPDGTGRFQSVDATALLQRVSSRRQYREGAEHDWADVEVMEDAEGSKDGGESTPKTVRTSAILPRAPPETPPAHLCGIPASSASRYLASSSENRQTSTRRSHQLPPFKEE